MVSNFNISSLSCDDVKEIFRFSSVEELRRLTPQLTEAQLEYVLATLPKHKTQTVKEILDKSSQQG